MNKLKLLVAGLIMIPVVAFAMPSVAYAQSGDGFSLKTGTEAAKGEGSANEITNGQDTIKKFVNILLWIVGILSVVFLIWGGIRYVTSAGDSNKVTAAKNTIVYAIVGLVVAIFAYALVNFVIANVGGN